MVAAVENKIDERKIAELASQQFINILAYLP
jgi:hypothetical protein